MKHLMFIFFLFGCSIFTSAQFILSSPELFVFYRGYDNKIDATSLTKAKDIHLSSPDFEFRKESETRFIGRATGEAGWSKIYMTDAKNGDTIDVFKVEIRNLPNPSLFFGGCEDGGTANKMETRFFAKYGPEIPLNVSFAILSGTIIIPNGPTLTFNGSQLNMDCTDVLRILPSPTTISVTLIVKGPDGNTRTASASYNL